MKNITTILIATTAIAFAYPVMAEETVPASDGAGAAPVVADQKAPEVQDGAKKKWSELTPEEREERKAARQAKWQAKYDKATPEERAKMDERKAKREAYKNMTPEERKKHKEERRAEWEEKYKNATPEERAQMDERKAKWKERHETRREEHREHHKEDAKEAVVKEAPADMAPSAGN